MQLSDKQQQIMAAAGHLLVTGGPGSGKTTVSILKAADIAVHCLRPAQKILFLSFARATVSRVIQAIEHEQQFRASKDDALMSRPIIPSFGASSKHTVT